METKEKRASVTISEDGSASYENPPYLIRAALKILTGWPQTPTEEMRQTAMRTIREWEDQLTQRRRENLDTRAELKNKL